MSYLVTARKWRPQIFDEVVGQEHISKTIKNAIQNNRIAHAYLFAGPRGVGKTTTARIFAKRLNCTSPKGGEPCNECDMCKTYNESRSLDIIEIDGASNRRIEEIRTLRESVKYAPTKGDYKVYIIDEVHMLTTESFNALLKTLEEPPDRTVFIFATTDVHKVPLTIISRCQRFDFRRIEHNTIKSTLKKIADSEKIIIDDASLTIIAKKADGALRDAQSLFDQIVSFCGNEIVFDEVIRMLNLIDDEIYFAVSDSILSKEFKQAFFISQKIYENGWNYIDFLNGLVEHFRNIMTVIIRKDSSLVEATEEIRNKYLIYEAQFSEGDVLRILNFLNKVQYELKSSQNQKLKLEVSLCHLIGLEKSTTISEILKNFQSDAPVSLSSKKKVEPVIHSKPDNFDTSTTAKVIQFEPSQSEQKPQIQNKELDSIVSQWETFIERVNSEKFTLGSHLSNSKPIELEGTELTVQVESKEDVEILQNNNSYISCLKTNFEEIFKKSYTFTFTSVESFLQQVPDTASKKPTPIGNVEAIPSNEQNPMITAIIKELGGREIK